MHVKGLLIICALVVCSNAIYPNRSGRSPFMGPPAQRNYGRAGETNINRGRFPVPPAPNMASLPPQSYQFSLPQLNTNNPPFPQQAYPHPRSPPPSFPVPTVLKTELPSQYQHPQNPSQYPQIPPPPLNHNPQQDQYPYTISESDESQETVKMPLPGPVLGLKEEQLQIPGPISDNQPNGSHENEKPTVDLEMDLLAVASNVKHTLDLGGAPDRFLDIYKTILEITKPKILSTSLEGYKKMESIINEKLKLLAAKLKELHLSPKTEDAEKWLRSLVTYAGVSQEKIKLYELVIGIVCQIFLK